MPSLLEQLRAAPNARFHIKFDLPTGRVVEGAVGPLVNGMACVNIGFHGTPTEEEIAVARQTINELMGREPEFMQVSNGPEEYQTAKAIGNAYMNGGSKEVN